MVRMPLQAGYEGRLLSGQSGLRRRRGFALLSRRLRRSPETVDHVVLGRCQMPSSRRHSRDAILRTARRPSRFSRADSLRAMNAASLPGGSEARVRACRRCAVWRQRNGFLQSRPQAARRRLFSSALDMRSGADHVHRAIRLCVRCAGPTTTGVLASTLRCRRAENGRRAPPITLDWAARTADDRHHRPLPRKRCAIPAAFVSGLAKAAAKGIPIVVPQGRPAPPEKRRDGTEPHRPHWAGSDAAYEALFRPLWA